MTSMRFFKDPDLGIVFYTTDTFPKESGQRLADLCKADPVVDKAIAGAVETESEMWHVMEKLSTIPGLQILYQMQGVKS